MHLGQTSLRLSGILAAGSRRRKIRYDLRVTSHVMGGQTSYVVKIPDTDLYLRFDETEWGTLMVFDGTRTDREAWEALKETMPELEVSFEELVDFADSCVEDLWEKTPAEKNLALLEKLRGERKERTEQSVFYMYFSAWDPQHFFNVMHPYLRWIWTRRFALITLGFVVAALFVFASDWQRILTDAAHFYNFRDKSWGEFLDLWILLLIVGFIHECAHGMTCHHYGGEVHQMGFLLMYFTPAFYTEVSDIYLFDQDYKRQWTLFAGIWVECFLCVLSLFVWDFTPPGSWLNVWSYKMALMTSVTGVVLNLNPLMKFDGYYMLCQRLKIDNLREDAFAYLKAWISRTIFRQDVVLPAVGRRRRRIYLTYASLAYLYTALILLLVFGWMRNIFTSKFGDWGYVLLGALIYLIFRKKLRKAIPRVGARLKRMREDLMAWRLTRRQTIVGTAVLLLFTVPPSTTKVTSDFTLEPVQRAEVRATVPGRIAEVRVLEGETVAAGQVLAVLSNPDITARASVLQDQAALAQRALAAARAQEDLAGARRNSLELQRLQLELAEATRKQGELTLHAPLAGVVTTPFVEQRVGDYLREGTPLATIADRHVLRARVLVRDWELDDVREGAKVKLKLRSYPFRTFVGRVQQIMPAAAPDQPVSEPLKIERQGQELTNFFAVVMECPNDDGALKEGMTGTARIYGKSYPLAWRMARTGWRWVHSQVW